MFKTEQGSSKKLGKYRSGNLLKRIIVIPSSLECGAIEVNGGEGLKFTLFEGSENINLLETLKPFTIELDILSTSTGWKVSAGRNLTILAVGEFS